MTQQSATQAPTRPPGAPDQTDPSDRDDPVQAVICGPGGQPLLNGGKSFEKWYQGGFVGPGLAFPYVIPPFKTAQPLALQASTQDQTAGNLNIAQLLGSWTNQLMGVRLYSQWLDRWLSKSPVLVQFLFGTPSNPALLMGSVYVKAGTALKAEVDDYSGVNNTAQLMGRGFRNLVQHNAEGLARAQEVGYWNKARKYIPYFLPPDYGALTPGVNQPGVPGKTAQQFTFTAPDVGDFYITGCYFLAYQWATSGTYQTGGTPYSLSNINLLSWTADSGKYSFVDPTILPMAIDRIFSSSFTITSTPGTGIMNAGQMPGGWGGSPWVGSEQYIHRLNRGTQIQMTVINNTAGFTGYNRFAPCFVGYLSTMNAPEGEFLAFPQTKGQISRPVPALLPGGLQLPWGAQRQDPNATYTRVAPQQATAPGGMPQAPGPAPGTQGYPVPQNAPPRRFFRPGPQQLWQGGQGGY